LNSVAAVQLGMTDPIGKSIQFNGRQLEIIGVTENFHYRSLHEQITPLVFMLETQQLWNIFVKLEGNRQQGAIQNLKNLYKTFNPGYTFDYRFLDYAYQSQYSGEKRVANLSLWFSILTVIIACLGLFGLAAYTAEKRVKEIGIRKVLGATPASIAYLLSFEFIKQVLIAIVIALPVSFYLIDEWLQRFAYSIDLEMWFFVAAGLIAVLIAVLTVGGQSIRASLANPTTCLKEE
jgi:putative ABC transport system permease protein